MKKFKHLYKQIIENYTEGGSIFNGFNDMMPRTAYSDFGVHRIGEGDSVSRLNAFIHKFLGGTYIDPNGAIKELKTRLNMVGLDFDFDGSKVKLNPGQNVFPVKLYGDVFGQTPTTDLSKGFDHGDDLPMLKLMINCNYDEETCMWSMNGKLGIIREKKNELNGSENLNEEQLNEIVGALVRGAMTAATRVGGGAVGRTVGSGVTRVGSSSVLVGTKTGNVARNIGARLRTGTAVPMTAFGAGGSSISASAARGVAQQALQTGSASARSSIGYLMNPVTRSTAMKAVPYRAGKLTGKYVTPVNRFVQKNPITSLIAYDYLMRGQNQAGEEGGEGGGGGGYIPGSASALSFQSPTTADTMSTVNYGLRESTNKEHLMEKSKLYKKIKDKIGEYGNKKMCEYGCGSKDEMGEYGYDSEEGEEGPMSSPAPPNEHVVGYMDQMGGPISESVSKDKARSVMHAINRKGELHDKVLIPVFNNLLSKKLKGKLGTTDIQKQLFYVVNSATRKLKLVLSDKEKSRVVNDLVRNFRSFSKKKHSTPHQKGKQTKKSK